MSDIIISPRAYTKMIFHAAKYPHLACNGLLLASKNTEKSKVEIVDAVPLFHQCLHVTPMAEIALIQVEAKVAAENLQIYGYYAAAENFYDNSLERAPGSKIAEKIAENNNSACFIVLDNKAICMEMKHPGIKVFQFNDNKWNKAKFNVADSKNTLSSVSLLLQRGLMKEINDFDNFLDNTDNDWQNVHLNKNLNQLLSMN